jgi:hypothetical protein
MRLVLIALASLSDPVLLLLLSLCLFLGARALHHATIPRTPRH